MEGKSGKLSNKMITTDVTGLKFGECIIIGANLTISCTLSFPLSCLFLSLALNLQVPAAAVIPAPIAYIKVVAVKKLVVGFVDE